MNQSFNSAFRRSAIEEGRRLEGGVGLIRAAKKSCFGSYLPDEATSAGACAKDTRRKPLRRFVQ